MYFGICGLPWNLWLSSEVILFPSNICRTKVVTWGDYTSLSALQIIYCSMKSIMMGVFCFVLNPLRDHSRILSAMKKFVMPWLVRSVGWASSCKHRGSLVQFPVRAHARVAGQAPGRGCARGTQSIFLSHINVFISPSFPLSLKINKILKKN